jgi:biotin-(acetyl-CoA carboxylase) ligase
MSATANVESLSESRIHWYEEVTSTMDKAKEITKSQPRTTIFAVVADEQSNGRGTRGRVWNSVVGNLYMTLAVKLSLVHIPLTLIPLRYFLIRKNCYFSNMS